MRQSIYLFNTRNSEASAEEIINNNRTQNCGGMRGRGTKLFKFGEKEIKLFYSPAH